MKYLSFIKKSQTHTHTTKISSCASKILFILMLMAMQLQGQTAALSHNNFTCDNPQAVTLTASNGSMHSERLQIIKN